jgi:hypothetical protein
MKSRVYKTMKTTGAGSIVIGVVMILAGVVGGVISIVNGGRLLSAKDDLL